MSARVSRPFDWRRTPGLPSFTGAILIFLYAPLLILVLYSFNASKLVTVWSGFSLRWFVRVANNDDIRSAAVNDRLLVFRRCVRLFCRDERRSDVGKVRSCSLSRQH